VGKKEIRIFGSMQKFRIFFTCCTFYTPYRGPHTPAGGSTHVPVTSTRLITQTENFATIAQQG
jgi:hypothetical protein